jgi:transcriptional regulator with XRE-family HTH domain
MNNFTAYFSNPEILSLMGERLQQWRIKKGLTQNELVKRTGLSRGAIQKLEAGTNVDLNTIVAVIRSLDLINNLNLFLPEPEPTIKSLKEIQSTTSLRKRVRKKKKNG